MKRGTPRHPKMQHLCEILHCELPEAVGFLELLWHFTAEFAPRGDIGRFGDDRIEAAMGWVNTRWRKRGDLIRALSTSRWIESDPDHRLIVHDWHAHADDSVRKRIARSGLSFVTDKTKMTGQNPPLSATLPDNGSLPLPEPDPKPEPVPKPPVRAISARWKSDSAFAQFREDYDALGGAFIESDYSEAYEFCWKTLDFEQRVERVRSLGRHAEEYKENPRFVPKPLKFLQIEWQRPNRPKSRDPSSARLSALDQARELAKKEMEGNAGTR